MWKLNKVHDLGMQSMDDNENEEAIQNRLKSFTNGSLVHPCTLSKFPLYS